MADEKEKKTERVHLLMSPKEVEAIDDFGFKSRIRTRGATIRVLVSMGLSSFETIHALAEASKALNEYVDTGKIQQETLEKFATAIAGTADVLEKSSNRLTKLHSELEASKKLG
ncbi:hypothetical protein KHP60_04475 [Microvirga sp. 3-52]|uniref:hypothetical protein n=1 Tax=Microvirga sp. 3-52 TaxID=2792425 RepID=UPI001AC5BEBE|nr:hypothetical protein [Microvirga sp. 3-52]MBO1903988.1 hypothetical protein [Microvirga sp. 3-52]MBS7451601.1 hypothetical protein [Microvirga sp. 3-52]